MAHIWWGPLVLWWYSLPAARRLPDVFSILGLPTEKFVVQSPLARIHGIEHHQLLAPSVFS